MSAADALHVRHVRRAIYGPPLAAAVGIVLLAIGLVGLATHTGTHHGAVSRPTTPATALAPPVSIEERGPYALVSNDGSAPIAGAAAAPGGGYWVATRDGRVIGVGVAPLGELRASRVAGIAAARGAGYWLATTDGHVYGFGTRTYGDLETRPHAPVVGIAASASGGYWLATNDGHVYAFGAARDHGVIWGHLRAPVVGIAASKTGGYWLATADGRVYFFGAPFRGETARLGVKERIIGIAASSTGGYWLAAADGRVYAFGTPAEPLAADAGRVGAIVPR